MNNIFKVIWNHATQTWTAVGELASAKGKSKSVKLAVISTALLAVAGGANAEEGGVIGPNNGSLSLPRVPNNGSVSFSGRGDKPAHAYAVDGIAIGNSAQAGQSSTEGDAGNAHIAIGLNAKASGGGAAASQAAIALGYNSKAEGPADVAIGTSAYAKGIDSVALGNGAAANSDGAVGLGHASKAEWNATAVGNSSWAGAKRAIAIGYNPIAYSEGSIAIGTDSKISGFNSVGVGRDTVTKGKESIAVGYKSTISSANVSTLGANITVEAGRDGGVVLGHSSDAAKDTTEVVAVNNATVGNLTYSGFAGKLDAPTTALQGHFVSVGKKGDERQIKHVAAGQITDKSTDAINGSQLYSVADTITTAIKNVLGEPTADGKIGGVTLSGDKGATSKFSSPVSTTQLTEDYKAPEGDKKPTTVAGALQDLNNYVNAGWKVGNNAGEKVSRITPNGQVNFKKGDDNNIEVKVEKAGDNKANVTYSLAKDIKVDSVTVGKDSNTTKIESDKNGLKLDDKKIQGVKNGNVAEGSKEAVNGGQLHTVKEELTKQINDIKKLNNNNQSGAFDRLERKINKQGKEARAGIAGANAAAALPQVYTAGKAMVAAAAGTFKGQNALAVGYSRISDNGKVILKLQGNANTSGDVGAGVGVGYQW